MRLKYLFISNYKNLKNFSLNLDDDSFIDVFVGKNGSGKSNLFEATIQIFRYLYEFDKNSKEIKIEFDFKVTYEIEQKEISISWESGALTVNDEIRKTIGQTILPDNILIYYSGHNVTVTDLVQKYEEVFSRRIKEADVTDSRRFIGIGPEYKKLLLAILLIQPIGNKAREFICKKLCISSVGDEMLLKLTRPTFANAALKAIEASGIEHFDQRTHYWGAQGIVRNFLESLLSCIKGEFKHEDIYRTSDDQYQLSINIKLFQQKFENSVTDIFRLFDNLKTLGMLDDISIPLTLQNNENATIDHFSDGQFQSVYIYSIIELFKDRNCLTLLDEPDAFLHPEWQFDFLKQVFEIADIETKKNHILMTSHSAATLCSIEEKSINFLAVENSNITSCKRSKKDVIKELSDSFIQYSEDESKLLIDNVLRSSSKPLLFVEGPSDVFILNAAYKKLFPGEDIPVLIQDAFDRGFIKTLMARNEIFATYPEKTFFALFDFDDAYEDWRDLRGYLIEQNINKGLCKKLDNKKGYAFLLPIPENELKAQVWDELNPHEKIKPNPQFCIEHVFWGTKGLERWFKHEERTGKIIFKNVGNKVRFAKEIIPTLDPISFEPFRSMFIFIKQHVA